MNDRMKKRDPKEKFIELANKRVNSAIGQLRGVRNLANKRNYSYTDAHVRKIVSALRAEVKAIDTAFKNGESNDQVFKL